MDVTGVEGRFRRSALRVEFEGDPELEGLVVRMRRMSVGRWLALLDVEERGGTSILHMIAHGRGVEVDELLGHLVEGIIEWNLDDEQGVPVPVTVEGLRGVDPLLITMIIKGWMRVVTGVSPPLPQPSADGDPSLEESMPMEPLSESPETLPTPA